MIKRIIEVAKAGRIHLKDRQLRIEQDGILAASVPVEDLGILLLANPANVVTQQVLAACQEQGAAVVVCDGRYLPAAIMLPLAGSTLHAETLHIQVSAKTDTVRRAWVQIVRAKIQAQSALLNARGCEAKHLEALAGRVRAGNSSQLEAQAAAYYWKALLGKEFRRDPTAPGLNALLNYGYAIMRAAVARAVVGAGLHPAWGLFHHNRYDSFALADDLLEPLRPAVDEVVAGRQTSQPSELGPMERRLMLELMSCHCNLGGGRLPLWVALQRYASSVKAALAGDAQDVEIPQWQFSAAGDLCG